MSRWGRRMCCHYDDRAVDMFALLRRRYVRETDEGVALSVSLPENPAKRPNLVLERDEIDESSVSRTRNEMKPRQKQAR